MFCQENSSSPDAVVLVGERTPILAAGAKAEVPSLNVGPGVSIAARGNTIRRVAPNAAAAAGAPAAPETTSPPARVDKRFGGGPDLPLGQGDQGFSQGPEFLRMLQGISFYFDKENQVSEGLRRFG